MQNEKMELFEASLTQRLRKTTVPNYIGGNMDIL
jgi:hypothetical protein